MRARTRSISPVQARIAGALLVACALPVLSLRAQATLPEDVVTLTGQYQAACKKVSDAASAERFQIEIGYVEALKRYEATLQKEGKLEALLSAKQQRALYENSRSFGTTTDPELVKLRQLLENSLAPIQAKETQELQKLHATYAAVLSTKMERETKSGNLETALAIKKLIDGGPSGQAPTMPSSGGATAPSTPTSATPGSSGPGIDPSELDSVPTLQGTALAGDPFELKEWPTNSVIPAANYRIRDRITPKWPAKTKPTVLLSEGTLLKGTGDSAELLLAQGSSMVGKNVQIEDFKLRGDLGTKFYFQNSQFKDSTMAKGGGWGSGLRPMSRWQFRECQIEGSFLGTWSPMHTGVQALQVQYRAGRVRAQT